MALAHLYIGVSTDEQANKGFSQRDQEQRLRNYCKTRNIKYWQSNLRGLLRQNFSQAGMDQTDSGIKKNKRQKLRLHHVHQVGQVYS